MHLTEQQISHFRTFGFVVFRQLLAPDEMTRYAREFDAGLDAWAAKGNYDTAKRLWAPLLDADTPFIASLLDDPRFADAAEQLLGKPVVGMLTDGNYYVGDTGWHPDTHTFDAIKFTIYLDPLTAQTGALRVIPGSHRDPLHSALHQMRSRPRDAASRDVFGVAPDELPAYAFESQPGDVLAFWMKTWHAAFGGSNHRRMGTIDYYEDPATPEVATAFQQAIRHHMDGYLKQWSGAEQHYPTYWRSIDRPRHRRWVSRMAELGVLDNPVPVG